MISCKNCWETAEASKIRLFFRNSTFFPPYASMQQIVLYQKQKSISQTQLYTSVLVSNSTDSQGKLKGKEALQRRVIKFHNDAFGDSKSPKVDRIKHRSAEIANPIKGNTIILHFSNSNHPIRIHQPRFPRPDPTNRKNPIFLKWWIPRISNKRVFLLTMSETEWAASAMMAVLPDK